MFGSFFFVVELKGSKGHSRREETDSQSSLSNAVDRFRDSYPALDWAFIKDPKNGECFYDVGITIQPEDERGLVGLWRLDCLEASFGAAGFLSGQLHPINTMALYGALQAESSEARCQRTQIVFHSAYSLTYEATRQQDNNRELFKPKDVYRRNGAFYKQLDKVHKIYQTKVSKKSYGMRDEYRVGAAALEEMMVFIDDVVSSKNFGTQVLGD